MSENKAQNSPTGEEIRGTKRSADEAGEVKKQKTEIVANGKVVVLECHSDCIKEQNVCVNNKIYFYFTFFSKFSDSKRLWRRRSFDSS